MGTTIANDDKKMGTVSFLLRWIQFSITCQCPHSSHRKQGNERCDAAPKNGNFHFEISASTELE